GAALPRLLPTAGDRTRRLVAGSYLITGVIAAALSLVFVVLGPRITDDLSFVNRRAGIAIAFCIAVVLWGVFVLQDAILTGLRQTIWVPVENFAFGLLKLAMLVVLLPTDNGYSVFLSWTLPIVFLILPVNLFVFRRAIPRHLDAFGHRAQPLARSQLQRYIVLDYTASLFSNVVPLLLPLVVLSRLGEAANGRFYAAWVIGVSLTVIVGSLAVSLSVEGALHEDDLAALTRKAVRKGALLGLPLLAAFVVLAGVVLRVYGPDYAGAANALRVLVAAAAARAVVDVFHALARIRRRVHTIVATDAAACCVTMALAIPLTDAFGITGVSLSYLIGQLGIAIAVSPVIARQMRAAPSLRADTRP
ncbi:MAG TPA: hypothetical protein VGQ20_07510, partial [Acidimicrobiales bacterium]|nr:hypothetical protein [Acidimicrobiales bacterium]